MKMHSVLLFFAGLAAVSAMTVRSSRMTYVSPDGAKKLVMERSHGSDLDSSATGFIYSSDGLGPATLRHLNSPEVVQTFHEYGPVLTPQQYVELKGREGQTGEFAESGEKGENGYDAYDAYKKGTLAKFNKNRDSGFYNNAAGHKKAAGEVAGYHGSANSAAKGESGSNSGQVSTARKGHKTTGFHKVYHKDEYKKEHSFYDEADHSGFNDKHEKGEQSFDQSKGGFRKGGRAESAFQSDEQGKKGFFDNGKISEEEEGYKGENGGQEFFGRQSHFLKKGSDGFRKRFGYSEER